MRRVSECVGFNVPLALCGLRAVRIDPLRFLTGGSKSRTNLLCVEWDVKPYTLTHLLLALHQQQNLVK